MCGLFCIFNMANTNLEITEYGNNNTSVNFYRKIKS